MVIAPSGGYLYRTTNSQWQGDSGNSNESYGQVPLQHFVNFDLLGPTFRVIFTGALGSSGVSGPGFTWNIRVGGAWAPSQIPAFSPITGDLVTLGQTGAIPAFGAGSATAIIANVWTGIKLVQLTGSLPGGLAFAQDPTLIYMPE